MLDPDALAEMVIETIKAALAPMQADVRVLQGTIATWDARWNDLGALRERVAVVEAKSAQPPDLSGVTERLSALQLRQEMSTVAAQTMASLGERVAVLETRAPVAGPAGKDGANGLNGKDGADGLGFDDLEGVYDERGRLSLKFVKGEHEKVVRVPCIVDRGVYREGDVYQKGDGVSFGGGFFIAAHDEVSEKPETGSGWRLAVKRGRDGRDGKDAPQPVPVVKVGAR